MRLLHTTKLTVEDFVETGTKSYSYAILSHTWGEEEVTFQDMLGGLPKYKKGFSKLERSCIQAKKDGHEYIWIDTCCIDKSSSAELSEAINSMYRWYEEANICYVYLSDVPSVEVEDPKQAASSFSKSRWFTRGWTLQELIAPPEVLFYCDNWSKLGTKRDLIDVVTEVTKVNKAMLLSGKKTKEAYSIAQKMSWAAKRTTTRLEDRAYSLIGLFDVNMPLLYGEGKRAFIRLQEEILKQTDDESLFAHQIQQGEKIERQSGSLLAESPNCFSQSENVYLYTRVQLIHGSLKHTNSIPSLITNKGLQIDSFGCPCTCRPRYGETRIINGWLMILNCQRQNDIFTRPAIFLRSLNSGENQFTRFSFGTLLMVCSKDGKPTLDRWTDELRLQRGAIYDKEIGLHQFVPDFENIHRRTIFVGPNRYLHNQNNNLSVTVEDIIQPEYRRFRLVTGTRNLGLSEKKLWMNHASGKSNTVFGQLMFEELETGERFLLIVYLAILNTENKVLSTEIEPNYQAWCNIIELRRDASPLSVLEEATTLYWPPKNAPVRNRAFIATLAVDDGYVVQAALSREDFLERTRFVLVVELRLTSDENLWKGMYEKRKKLFDTRDGITEDKRLIGYRIE